MNDDFAIPGRLNLWIAAGQAAVLLGLLAAAGSVSSPWALAGLAIGYALVMNSAYAMLHEAEHGSLHPNRVLNDAVGAGLALFFPAPFHLLRQGHIGHHLRNRSDDEAFDFYFDGADFWSRRGVDATGDFYFVLYNDGQVVYNGLEDKKNGKMVFKGASSFMTVAAGMPIDAIGFAFDNDDYDHLAMDNFRFRVDATTLGSVTAVPEPHTTAMLLAGLGVIGVMGRRRRQHQAQSEKL